MVKGCGLILGLFLLLIVGSCIKAIVSSEIDSYEARQERKAEEEAEAKKVAQLQEIAAKEKAEREACIRAEKEAAESKARMAESKARAAKRELERKSTLKEEKLRSFTLREAPVLWKTYQNLQAEIEAQNGKIASLRKDLLEFDLDPNTDEDFKRICAMRDEMIVSLKTMRTKIEAAYLASRKYEATPGKKEYGELMRKALEDGIQEADAAASRYRSLSQTK